MELETSPGDVRSVSRSREGLTVKDCVTLRTRREIFLRAAAQAEMKALGSSDPELKLAWTTVAGEWIAMARELKAADPKGSLGAVLSRLAARESKIVN